jgi:hypothetical protein
MRLIGKDQQGKRSEGREQESFQLTNLETAFGRAPSVECRAHGMSAAERDGRSRLALVRSFGLHG